VGEANSDQPCLDGVELDWEGVFQSLTSSKLQIAMVVSGGGSGAVARCFRRPGASAIFVEAVIAYSRKSQASYLQRAAEGTSASPQRARQLAATALARAQSLSDHEFDVRAAGISLVAALPTQSPRRGEDRIHVALKTSSRAAMWTLALPKGVFDRATAEAIADEMLYIALARLSHDDDQASDLSTLEILRHGLQLTREDD
jgi:hypothetical protein